MRGIFSLQILVQQKSYPNHHFYQVLNLTIKFETVVYILLKKNHKITFKIIQIRIVLQKEHLDGVVLSEQPNTYRRRF